MPPSTWTKLESDILYKVCHILIVGLPETNEDSKSTMILGLPFLNQFAMSFNVNEKTIKVAPSVFADDKVTGGRVGPDPGPSPGPKPSPDDPDSKDNGIGTSGIIFLVIILVLFLFTVITICVCWIMKRRRRKERDYNIAKM